MQIGKITFLKYPVFLAPMEDVTDGVFRRLCKHFGADMVYTEFISSDGLIRHVKKTKSKLAFDESERPIGIQIYGHLKEAMVEAAKIAEEANPDLIDINFGCPVKKIARRGAGSGMMNNVPLMVEITDAIVKAVKLPVTVKTRLGYDQSNKNIVEIAERLQDVGIKAITIHGRTRDQMYTGKADWTLIAAVKNNPRMHIPVIGNGDINSAPTAREAFEKYGVDAIMIGRATIGRPWIFSEVKTFLNTGEIILPPKIADITPIVRQHLQLSINDKGEKSGILHLRRHLANYFKGLPNFRNTRIKLLTAISADEIMQLLDYIDETYGDFHYSNENT